MTIHDAQDLSDGTSIRADVCIVGAGPAGITLGLTLKGHGISVVMLEGGGELPRPEIQALYAGANEGAPYTDLDLTRLRYLGGSTNHWEGYVRPLDASDLAEPLLASVGGWPFGYEELSDHYETASQVVEVNDELDYSGERWAQRVGAEVLPTDASVMGTEVLLRSPPVRFGPKYRDELAESEDIALYLNANAVELATVDGRVQHVRIAHLEGGEQTVGAQVFVLATGGIEVPRLLLSSLTDEGVAVGNRHDLVGRFFMEHPHFIRIQLLCEDARALAFYTEESLVDGQRVNPILTIPSEVRRARGMGNVAVSLQHPEPTARDILEGDPVTHSVRALLRDATDRERPDHLRVQLMAEQVPNARSRIRLSNHQRDALGLRRCILNWELHEVDYHTLRTAAELAAGQFAHAGVGRISSTTHGGSTPYAFHGGHHHMGTARMSEDPARGVVDANGLVHDVENLYIASSATFPTVGFANPTLTIVAMALRLGQHLREEGVR